VTTTFNDAAKAHDIAKKAQIPMKKLKIFLKIKQCIKRAANRVAIANHS